MWHYPPLYQRYSRILYSLVYRMVSDHHIAEDLIQDAFLSVWRRAISYSPQSGAVRNWLISIVHHRTIDYLRSVRRRSALKEATWEEVEQDEHAAFPDVWDEVWRSVRINTQQGRGSIAAPPAVPFRKGPHAELLNMPFSITRAWEALVKFLLHPESPDCTYSGAPFCPQALIPAERTCGTCSMLYTRKDHI